MGVLSMFTFKLSHIGSTTYTKSFANTWCKFCHPTKSNGACSLSYHQYSVSNLNFSFTKSIFPCSWRTIEPWSTEQQDKQISDTIFKI